MGQSGQSGVHKMSQKYCLKWNKFQENLYSSLGGLRESREFADVTLACEDGQQVEAHKVILAASSPFFQNILRSNPHQHPLIYMRGMKAEDLVGIVDFLYHGEVNILQDNLDNFLTLAEEIQLKGLTNEDKVTEREPIAEQLLKKTEPNFGKKGKREPKDESENEPLTDMVKVKPIAELVNKETPTEEEKSAIANLTTGLDKSIAELSTELENISENKTPIQSTELVNFGENYSQNRSITFSGELNDLDEVVKSLIVKSENFDHKSKQTKSLCKVCGREGYYANIKEHIEAIHVEGITITCELCDKIFRTRDRFRKHKVAHSKKEQQQQLSLELI